MKRANAIGTSVTHLLHRAGQCAEEIFHVEMQNGDLTPRQLAVLVAVAGNEGLSQTALVDCTGVDRSTMAATAAGGEAANRGGLDSSW